MGKVHELAAEVASLILSESETHQFIMPGVEHALVQQLTAPEDSPIFSGCTGERREHVRRLRTSILEMTVAGIGAKSVAKALQISPQAVRAVRASAWQRGELDPLKQRLGREYLATADLLRAEALERIDEIPAHVLLLASAQSADKGQLLTGGATQRVETRPVPADLNDLIDALPVAAELVESGETATNKGDSPAVLLDAPSTENALASDSISDASTREAAARVSRSVSKEDAK
jgi:hypothetical protein